MRSPALLFTTLLAGCATTVSAPLTRPVLDVSARALPPLPTRSVLVVSTSTFMQVSPDLAFNPCLSSASAGSRAYGAACPPSPFPELAAISALTERTLFDAGWEPVTQAAAARLITSSRVATGLRSLLSRGQASLLEGALLLGNASSADLILVVSDWWTNFASQPASSSATAKLCPLEGVLGVEAYGRGGLLLWRGQVTSRTTDLGPVSLTGTEASPAGAACVARQSCAECATAPVSADAAQALMSAASSALVGAFLAAQPVP